MVKIYHLEDPFLWDCLLIVRRLGYELSEFKISPGFRYYFRGAVIGYSLPEALETMETIQFVELEKHDIR